MKRDGYGVDRRGKRMSLRRKIVLLFLWLAVMPMLTVATFGFIYAGWLAENVTQSRLSDASGRIASEVQAATGRVEEALTRLSKEYEATAPGGARPWADLVATEPVLANAAHVRISSVDGRVLHRQGSRPTGDVRCDASGGSRLVDVRFSGDSSGGAVEASFWASDLIPEDLRRSFPDVRVVDRSSGRTYFSPRCEDLTARGSSSMAAALAALTRSPDEGGPFRYKDRLSDVGVGAIRVSPNRQWAAVTATGVSGIMAPLSRLQAWYWVFILLLAASTVAAFSLLLGRVTESLKELTGAAKRIGGGDLQPWLPPPSNDEVGQLTVAFSDMLDRLRHMMAHVDHKGRLAVVGQLSSYLAHEIRNPLSSIKMNLQRLHRNVLTGHVPADCSDAVEISLKEVDRLASSVTSILQLGRSDQGPSEVVSLHEVIEEVAELLQGEMKRAGVELQVELDASADRVVAVAGQIKGVFVNLIMNALEAQPQGGAVRIRSELRASTTREPVVAVRVRDLGCGVPSGVRDRIFEPFFTTKGTGSGIGLAVVARTLNDHGGDIRLEDLPPGDSGAEFVVSLPLAAVGVDAEAAAAAVDARRAARRWRGPRSQDDTPRAPAAVLPSSAADALTAWAKDRGQVH